MFILSVEILMMCNVKEKGYSDEPTENHHPALKFPSALWSVLNVSTRCFGFTTHNFTVLVQSHSSY